MRGSLGQCKKGTLDSSNASTKKKVVTFSDRLSHTEPLFLNLDILPIDKLIQNSIGLFMYKMFYGLHPIGIMYSQNCDVHSHDTRKKNNLHVAIGYSDLYAKSFYCTSIIIWNNIMNKINIAVSFPKFKKLRKSYLHCNTLNM